MLYVCCYFALKIFAQQDTAIVDLGYARYQGVSYLDPVNHTNNTQFLGIRYGAAPTGRVVHIFTWITFSLEIGSRRFRGPQLPPYTSGVQLANEQPSECFQAWFGSAPESPFRINKNSTNPSSSPKVQLNLPGGSEDCLFLKYIFMMPTHQMCIILTSIMIGQCLHSWRLGKNE